MIATRTETLFGQSLHAVRARTDRLFAALMGLQWIAAIAVASWVSPRAWGGASSSTLSHVWIAILLGGAACALPAALGLLRPGRPSTRYAVAAGQMLMGALLIHLAGGRVETHFHVFASLALLALYRDWRVLAAAAMIAAADHALRGVAWPQSIYGVVAASPWRWVEHAAWTILAAVALVVACRRSLQDMKETAERTAALDDETGRRHEAEQALARAVEDLRTTGRRAEAAARARSEFLAGMSREVRTPLNALILHCELLQQEADGRLHRDFLQELDRIRSSGNDLLSLLNGIVDLSKIDAGKMRVSLEPFDLRALIQGVAQTVDPLMQRHGNRLAIYYADEVGAMCADEMKTRQILLNILTNAAKFTRDGTVTVDVGFDRTAPRPTVFFAVADTGVGMTPQQMVRIFDPFAQADATAARKPGGNGLGLAIVSRFCRLMGGTVSVESCPGRGSRFIVRLPRDVAASADAADAA